MKLKYTLFALVALISPLKGGAVLTNDQEKELYYFLNETKDKLTMDVFIYKMNDLKINETDKERMIQEMRLLSKEKNATPQDLVNVIMKTLLKDYAPLGNRTYSQYQGLENQAVPEWLNMDQDDDMLDLGSKFSKAKHLKKRDEKAKEKEEIKLKKEVHTHHDWAMDID